MMNNTATAQSIVEHLHFGENWNKGKCNNKYFTTIRLWNEKYKVGTKFQMYLRKRYKGVVEVVDVKKIYLRDINDWMARLDTGYSAETTQDIIRKMYKHSPLINWDTQYIAYVMLKYTDSDNESNLF